MLGVDLTEKYAIISKQLGIRGRSLIYLRNRNGPNTVP